MPNIISNASGAINETVAITQAMVSDQYKLTYTCSNVGDGKSFLLITGDNTYFFPLQFTGQQEVLFNAEFGSLIQCVLHGNASINGLTLATNDTLNDDDRQAIDLVKTDSEYWQKIKDIVDENDKIRADKMAGILNMTLNSFANKNGTVTQKDGIYTWMNGSSYETATEAVRVSGGAIGVSNKKDGQGDWVWRTAITGAGIHADTIIAKSLATVDFSSANIKSCDITTADLKSCTLKGGELYIGDNPDNLAIFTGCIVQQNGFIKGYYQGTETFSLVHTPSGKLRLYSPTTGKSIVLDSYTGELYADAGDGITIQSGVDYTNIHGTKINTRIEIRSGEINLMTFNSSGTQNGTVNIAGNLNVRGDISCYSLSQQD